MFKIFKSCVPERAELSEESKEKYYEQGKLNKVILIYCIFDKGAIVMKSISSNVPTSMCLVFKK